MPQLLLAVRAVSGTQPTGRLHWGNYFGAIHQWIALQDDHDLYCFIADLHALTTLESPRDLSRFTFDAAVDLLALGLDPERSTLFVQSDVPEICELYWLLMTVAPLGLLERGHAYKDRKSRQLPTTAALLSYPVLMAADILAYDARIVPVGADQLQHLEVCRDLAARFNHRFGATFTLPEARVRRAAAEIPGTDGVRKMSKAHGNTVALFEDPAEARKKIQRIRTDSRPPAEPKDPESDVLFQLYSLFATPGEREAMAARYRRGGFGYGEVKQALADAAEHTFAPARERRLRLQADPRAVRRVLDAGARRARARARDVLDRARSASGLTAGGGVPPS